MQRDGDFGDFQSFERGFDDHFGREFHSGRLQIHFFKSGFREAAQSGVKIMRGTFEK